RPSRSTPFPYTTLFRSTFTWEAVFRPDGGQTEQRWFHLSEQDPTGADTANRMLFELRVAGDQWCLDSYHQSGTESKALLNRKSRSEEHTSELQSRSELV